MHSTVRHSLFIVSNIVIGLQDPSIKEMAEQIAKDPAFNQMAQQLQRSVQNVNNDGVPELDTNQYINAMQQVMQNPQFMTMAERLGTALMQVRSCSSYMTALMLLLGSVCFGGVLSLFRVVHLFCNINK